MSNFEQVIANNILVVDYTNKNDNYNDKYELVNDNVHTSEKRLTTK